LQKGKNPDDLIKIEGNTVKLYTDIIADYIGVNTNKTEITFKLDTQKYFVPVRFTRENPKVGITIELDEEISSNDNSFQFVKSDEYAEKLIIGKVIVRNAARKCSKPSLADELTLKLNGKEEKIYFDAEKNHTPNKIRFEEEGIKPGQPDMEYPFYLKLNEIPNPDEEEGELYKISAGMKHAVDAENDFILKPAEKFTGIGVSVYDINNSNKKIGLQDNDQAKIQTLKYKQGDKGAIFKIRIRNNAQGKSGLGALIVKSIKAELDSDLLNISLPKTYKNDRDNNDIGFFKITTRSIDTEVTVYYAENVADNIVAIYDSPENGIKFNDGDKDKFLEIECRFNEFKFKKDQEDQEVNIAFTFNYSICNGANESDIKPFKINVAFTIMRHLGDKWLILDYGTSAITAAFFHPDDNKFLQPLNLIEHLDEEINMRNYDENKLLSSSVVLRCKGKVFESLNGEDVFKDVDKYDSFNGYVRLAPRMVDFFNKQEETLAIPPLKSIISYGGLLQIFEDKQVLKNKLKSFKYIDIETILHDSYYTVFSFFIPRAVKSMQIYNNEDDELHKFLITIPNTYTENHKSIIKQVILDNVKFKKSCQIKFLYESDAVAFHYFAEQDKYSDSYEDEEFVLIYDIGAGSTDVTYFKIETDENGNERIDILGRTGISIAGNYYDYWLANEFMVKYKSASTEFEFSDDCNGSNIDDKKMAQLRYKFFIKNILKPIIAKRSENIKDELSKKEQKISDNEMFFKGCKITKENILKLDISSSDFRDENLLNKFSHELFDNFIKLYGFSEPRLDKVLFSGRMSQLLDIQESVKIAINKHFKGDGKRFLTVKNNENFLNYDEVETSKNILLYGAGEYLNLDELNTEIKNEKAFISIGYVINRGRNKLSYKSIISPDREFSIREDSQGKKEQYIYEETNLIDLHRVNNIRIIQSTHFFNDNEDVFSKIDYNKLSSSTVEIYIQAKRDISYGKIKIAVELIKDKHTKIFIKSSDGDIIKSSDKDFRSIDILDNESFVISMWPFLDDDDKSDIDSNYNEDNTPSRATDNVGDNDITKDKLL